MKDKKFLVMCILLGIWLLLLIGLFTGEGRVNPRVEYLVTFLCVGWFAYWSLSTLRNWLYKDKNHSKQKQLHTKPIKNANTQNQ